MKQKFDIIESTCVPAKIDNLDTDQIIPARFLKQTVRDEGFYGQKLFCDRRFNADGSPNAGFPLNDSRYSGCILVAGANFGCGSSREHAAWALAGYGFRVVVSSSFADIHRQNELNNFVLPVQVSPAFLENLFAAVEAEPSTVVRVDVPAQTISFDGHTESFELDPYKKICLMNAQDDIDYLLSTIDDIERYEKIHS
ncbi:MAG: 3-isopropylmalate dehydratase small subunit [Candidatus Cryptobacteroides sp.]